MKRLLLIVSVFAFAALSSFAQTEDLPLALTIGENRYSNDNFQNKTVVYYSYTNDTGYDQVLIFKAETASTTFKVMDDGEPVVHSEQVDRQVFEVAKDKTVTIEVDNYSKEIAFNASLVQTDLTTDLLPLPTEGTDVYLPSKNGNPIMTTYTASKTGLLCIAFNHAQTSYPVWEDEYDNIQEFGYESDFDGDKLYVAKFLVIEGQKYTITFNNPTPDLLNIYVDSADDGTTIDGPFVGVIGENKLPAKAGHYYYSFERKDYIGHRWMIFSSEASLEGGNLRVYTSTTDTQPKYSVNNYIIGRMKVSTSEDNNFIRIEKTQDTENDETFTISLDNTMIPEDSVATCPSVEAGNTYIVPHYNGTYYYRISVPSDNGTKYLVVDGGDKAKNSTVQVGPSYQYETYISKSTTGCVRAAVTAGQEYIITWKPNEGINDFPFTISYEDIEVGESEDFPKQAFENKDYTIPAEQTRYYTYIATKDCNIVAQVSDLNANVVFKKMGYSNITVGTERKDNTYSIRANEGENYLIVVTAAENDVNLRIVEIELGNGESAESAIEIDLGQNDMTDEVHDVWYKYVAKTNGMLNVSSNIDYESDPMNPTKGSDITVLFNDINGTPQSILAYDSNWNMVYSKDFDVRAEQVVYIHVKTYSVQTDKSVTLTIRDYNDGESPLKPLELAVGENTLPQTNSLTQPVWYTMQLAPCEFSISQPQGKSFNFNMYNANDEVNPIATTQREGEFGAYTYVLRYTVADNGTYLFKLTNSQQDEVVVVNGEVDKIEDLTLSLSGDDQLYNIKGQKINKTYKGIVIKNGKKVINK